MTSLGPVAHRRLIGGLAALSLFGLMGCQITESYLVDMAPGPLAAGPGCHSTLGSYTLPKAHFRLLLTQSGSDHPLLAPPDGDGQPLVAIVRQPDPKLNFCLDYASSPLSKDDIKILKSDPKTNKPTPYLTAVLINATDQTSVIVQALARAALTLVSGSSAIRSVATTGVVTRTIADLEFDPFSGDEIRHANETLTRYGFCVVLDGFTAGKRPGEAERYCADPRHYAATPVTQAYEALAAVASDPASPALFYRPRQSYRVTVYQKPDPRGPGRWEIRERKIVQLENLSPVLALDISRAAFAGKQVNFGFDQGVLTIACVSKASELLGFADIPLSISRSLVQLPTTMLQVRINQATKSAELVNAETQLLQIQQAEIALLQTGQYAPPSGFNPNYPSSAAAVAPFDQADFSKTNLALLSDDDLQKKGFLTPPLARAFGTETPCPVGAS